MKAALILVSIAAHGCGVVGGHRAERSLRVKLLHRHHSPNTLVVTRGSDLSNLACGVHHLFLWLWIIFELMIREKSQEWYCKLTLRNINLCVVMVLNCLLYF